MKITRSTKCTLRFASQAKRQQLKRILKEYSKVCNFFIHHFWKNGLLRKSQLLKPVVDLPLEGLKSKKEKKEDPDKNGTWLSARLRKVAAREALDMVKAAKERWKGKHKDKAVSPRHRGRSMRVSSTIVDLQDPKKANHFDHWLHLASIGNKVIFDLPVLKHRHFNKYDKDPSWKRNNAYVIHLDYVQFSFQKEFEFRVSIPDLKNKIKTTSGFLGLDTGIKKLASLSDGSIFGTGIQDFIARKKACISSQGQQTKAISSMRQRIDQIALEVVDHCLENDIHTLVVENLKNLKKGTKVQKKLHKEMRRTLGAWTYAYWLQRLEMTATANRVRVLSVPPAYTSQRCPCCTHTERANRKGEYFECLSCGHKNDADLNAAQNILVRGLSDLGVDPSISAGVVCNTRSNKTKDKQAGLAPTKGKAGDTVPVHQP